MLAGPMWLVLNTVVPVFAIVALGYWLGGRRRADPEQFAVGRERDC